MNKKPILVTGSHKSGSTWVGKMLSASDEIGYIQEPFSLSVKLPHVYKKFDIWYKYLSEENASEYEKIIYRFMRFDYPLLKNLSDVKSKADLMRVLRHGRNYFISKYKNKRPLVKDPIAFFSSEWLAARYNMEVIVMVRHPAAFCSSLGVRNWRFDFNNFLNQPDLMERYLSGFEEQIHRMNKQEYSPIEQGILLWNIFYSTALEFKKHHPNWYFPTHELISADPITEFAKMYQDLDITMTEKVKKVIEENSGSHNSSEYNSKGDAFVRNAKENIKNWKKRLSEDDIKLIRRDTEAVASHFYSDGDW